MQKKSLMFKIVKSRFFVIIIMIILVFFAVGFFRSFWRDYQIRQEINQLEESKKKLEEQKIKTLDLLEQLEGDYLAEKEARLNFGLVKPGEQVVIITGETQRIATESFKKEEEKEKSNIILWREYFFAPRNN